MILDGEGAGADRAVLAGGAGRGRAVRLRASSASTRRRGSSSGVASAPQTQQAMKNIEAILAAAGFAFADVVQAQIFLEDMDDYGAVNGVYRTFFPQSPPARAAVEVAGLPLDAKVEILVVAVRSRR